METHYDKNASFYAQERKPDPGITLQIHKALEGCTSILNIGAGTGSYEPVCQNLVALEPSIKMINQRKCKNRVIQGIAENLPFADKSFDAVMAILTIHHWSDLAKGLSECRRVARKKIAILTWNPESDGFWLTQQYFPQILEIDQKIFPTLSVLQTILGTVTIENVLVPADCTDGFLGAYWKRPEAYLDDRIRSAMSSFSKIGRVQETLLKLGNDIQTGKWFTDHSELLKKEYHDVGYRLIIAEVK